jgi:hypothetical protein
MSDMQPPLDEDLVRLFENAHAPLPPAAFLARFERRMARARRVRLAVQVAGLALLAGVVVIIAPYAIRGSLTLSSYAADGLLSLGVAMMSPVGWVGSLILGGWVLRRCHVLDR